MGLLDSLNPASFLSSAAESLCDALLPKNLEFVGDLAALGVDFQTDNWTKGLSDLQDLGKDLPQQLSTLSKQQGGTAQGASVKPGDALMVPSFLEPSPPPSYSTVRSDAANSSGTRGAQPNQTSTAKLPPPPTRGGLLIPPGTLAVNTPTIRGTAPAPASSASAPSTAATQAPAGKLAPAEATPSTSTTSATTAKESSAPTTPPSVASATETASKATSTATTPGTPATPTAPGSAAPSQTTASPTSSSSTQSSTTAGTTGKDPFFALSDADLMNKVANGEIPDSVKKDPAQMQSLQARMNMISEMNHLISQMMSAMHEMNQAVIQNIRA